MPHQSYAASVLTREAKSSCIFADFCLPSHIILGLAVAEGTVFLSPERQRRARQRLDKDLLMVHSTSKFPVNTCRCTLHLIGLLCKAPLHSHVMPQHRVHAACAAWHTSLLIPRLHEADKLNRVHRQCAAVFTYPGMR